MERGHDAILVEVERACYSVPHHSRDMHPERSGLTERCVEGDTGRQRFWVEAT